MGAFEAVHTPKVAEIFARDEKQLVAYATDMGFKTFFSTLSYWAQLAAPEETEERAQAECAVSRRGMAGVAPTRRA